MAGESVQPQSPRASAQLRRWQRGGRCARPGCGASSLSPLPPRACQGPVPILVPAGVAGALRWGHPACPPSPGRAWQVACGGSEGNVPKIEAERPREGWHCHYLGMGTPARLAASPGGGTGGHPGLGKPPGRGGSAFPLIGAANGGSIPLPVLAGGTSCATARAAVLIKLPGRGDGARWPPWHGDCATPPAIPWPRNPHPVRASAATSKNAPVPSKCGILIPRNGKCGVDNTGGLIPSSFPPKIQPRHLLHPPPAASNTSKGVFLGAFLLLSPFLLPPFPNARERCERIFGRKRLNWMKNL